MPNVLKKLKSRLFRLPPHKSYTIYKHTVLMEDMKGKTRFSFG